MTIGYIMSVVVAAVVAWLIGAIWYSPLLFAKAWVEAQGHTPEKVAAMQANAAKAYAGSLLAFVLMAAVLKIFLRHLGADSLHDGAWWAFHAWLGFALPIGFTQHLYSDKPIAAFYLDTGYQLIYLVAMGAILGAWR